MIAQDTEPSGVAFSSDGTKMYISGLQHNAVYQYTLSVKDDVSTATYSGASFSVSAQETSTHDLAFSTDGTKMFIIGAASDRVWQYNLATAWSVSTASYSGNNGYVGGQEVNPYGLDFSTDGTKMYIVGFNNKTVYQYTLGTAWNPSTASYSGLSISVASQDGTIHGVAFSLDGKRMFIAGDSTNSVYQYDLSTAWNVSTATYNDYFLNVYNLDGNPYGITFNSGGTKMYISGVQNDQIYQYNSTSKAYPPTVPASVQNPPIAVFEFGSQASYTFVTNDGGTTVKLIGEGAC